MNKDYIAQIVIGVISAIVAYELLKPKATDTNFIDSGITSIEDAISSIWGDLTGN